MSKITNVNYVGDIYIRNKSETLDLSVKTSDTLTTSRKKRLKEAAKDDDMFYMINALSSISTIDIFKMLVVKLINKYEKFLAKKKLIVFSLFKRI